MKRPQILLASASPRRAELLAQLGLTCVALPQDIDESRRLGEPPLDYVQRMAREKAAAATPALAARGGVLIASDTCVSLRDEVFGKPDTALEAAATLSQLSDTTHSVRSAVCVLASEGDGEVREVGLRVAHTRVRFCLIDEAAMARYWQSGEPLGKAGGYAIQGLGAQFVRSIEGSYSGVMGLPLFETAALLGLAGVEGMLVENTGSV